MPEQWINIDTLGTVGIKPDLNQTSTEPQSLTDAVNVRAIGPDIGNAGGYSLIVIFPSGECQSPIVPTGNGLTTYIPIDEVVCYIPFSMNPSVPCQQGFTVQSTETQNYVTSPIISSSTQNRIVIYWPTSECGLYAEITYDESSRCLLDANGCYAASFVVSALPG